MNRQRIVLFGGVLTTTVALTVAGVAARPQRPEAGAPRAQAQPDDVRDRRVIRLDGRGRQLGITINDADGPGTTGAKVSGVDEKGAAAKAGVATGDVVVEFDGERVRSARQLSRLVQETPAGRTVKMTVLRGGNRRTLDVTPEAVDSDWNARFGPELRDEIERGLGGLNGLGALREMPRMGPGTFDFRMDGIPALAGRARLGVQIEPLTDQLASYFGVSSGGVLVASVTAESPAGKAGLKAGDVITAVNGEAVKAPHDLVEALAEAKDGATVTLAIVRDKKTSTVTATMERPARPTRL